MAMRIALRATLLAAAICLAGASGIGESHAQAQQASPRPDNAACLGCHGSEGFAMPGADGKMRDLHVIQDKFQQSVHGKRQCVDCHTNITKVPHEKVEVKVSCVSATSICGTRRRSRTRPRTSSG